jgi:hypothetical protein
MAALLLRPGEPGWEEVEVTCPRVGVDATYYMVGDQRRRTAALWSSAGVTCGIATLPPPLPGGTSERYMLEFHGELACVDVVAPRKCQQAAGDAPRPAAAVSIHQGFFTVGNRASGSNRPKNSNLNLNLKNEKNQ